MKKLAGVTLIVAAGMWVAAAPAGTRTTVARAAGPLTRYSIVNGCYSLGTPSGRVGPFRMQATALGQYLMYAGPNAFLGPGLKTTAGPSDNTVWQVDGHFTITNLGTHERVSVTFTPASGCATYPEAGVDATGRTLTGSSPEGQVTGTIDAHTHVTAFEFLGGDWHCGRPWHPFGIPFALPDCAPYEQGTNGLVESFIDYGAPVHPHDTRGWPSFAAWPSPTDLAEEGDYYTGIKRAWMAGLRVMVTQLVDNEALCTLMTTRRNPCNDMQAVELQARDLRALQDYIDAQSGGPGKGFFRIVTNPFQARQVINSGKLAVVEGIEVSHVFNCGETLGVPDCSPAKIDAGLAAVRKLGVSTFFPIHKFDNAFGGTKMDSGELGVLVNLGQHLETGQFWDIQTCTGPEHDSTQLTSLPDRRTDDAAAGPGWPRARSAERAAADRRHAAGLPTAAPLQRAWADEPRGGPDQQDDPPALHRRARPHGRQDRRPDALDPRAAPLLGRHLRPLVGFAGAEPADLQARRVHDPDRRGLAAVVRLPVAGEPQGA